MKTPHIIAVLAVLALFQTGCHTPLRDEPPLAPVSGNAVVTLRYFWPDTLVKVPDAMSVVFYPADTAGMIWRFTLPPEGADVRVPSGRYMIMTHSADPDGITLTAGGNPASALASIGSPGDSIAPGAGGMLWGAATAPVEIYPEPLPNRISILATPVTASYRITVRLIADEQKRPIDFAPSRAQATLGGMAREMELYSGRPVQSAAGVALSLPMWPAQREGAALTGRLISLGPQNPGPRESNPLTVTFTDCAGRRWRGVADVGHQIAVAPYDKAVYITVDTLVAVPDGGEGGVWSPVEGVDDWTTVTIDIGMQKE